LRFDALTGTAGCYRREYGGGRGLTWRCGVQVARWVFALLPCARTYPEDKREDRKTAPDPFLTADELVAGVSEAMVAFHLSGWHVLAFFSTRHVGPDIEIELFILTRDGATGSTSIDLSADI
jgi:hypothetical protein